MKIALFGVTGTIGQRIAREAIARGHQVTAIVRDPARTAQIDLKPLNVVKGDVTDAAGTAALIAGHDVVITAVGPNHAVGNNHVLVDAAKSLVTAIKKAGVERLVIVGGAGSLEVAPGLQLVDTPEFPEAWKPGALAHRDALEVYKHSDVNWTFFSPAGSIEPGTRTGKYRLGKDQLLVDNTGQSKISAEDYAVALLDEVENPKFVQQRFTAAY